MYLALANMNAIGIGIKTAVRMRNRIPGFPTSKTRNLLFSSTTNTSENDNEHQRQQHQQQPKQRQKSKYLLPKRIILIRHGESLGNIDDTGELTYQHLSMPQDRIFLYLT